MSGSIRFKKRLYLLISGTFLLSFPHTAFCQSTQKPIQMGPVLPDSIQISGNFGELRSNHFHSGIDFKTGEKEGKPVYAAAEGYISRFKVSANGYGKVVYITHPNDIVTVYGHLRIFYPALEDTVKKRHTNTREYEMELFPDSTVFPIKRGDLLGYSGNSGSSAGPHLHFETRNRFSEKPFNPEIAGYRIEDTIPPLIKAVAIYNPGPHGGLAGSSKQLIEFSQKGGTAGPKDTITTTGNDFFVGFEPLEMAGVEPNQLGIRAFMLYLDDSLIFNARIDSFSFDETRMMNAMIDYPFYTETGRKLVLCHVLKGNRLSFLANQNGIITLNEFRIHKLKLRVEDTSGNFAETWIYVRKTGDVIVPFIQKEGTIYHHGDPMKITTKSSIIDISPFSFYEDLRLEVIEKNPEIQNSALLSPVIKISPKGIPVHDLLTISIKPEPHDSDFTYKFIGVSIDSTGVLTGLKSKYENGFIVFKTRSMGDFAVSLDTIAPLSKPPLWEPDDYSGTHKLIIELESDLSGIANLKCLINEIWTASEYNPRKNRITIYPEDIPKTTDSFQFRLELIDMCGNQGNYQYSIDIMR